MIGLNGMRARVKGVWAEAVIVAIMVVVSGCELPGSEQTAQPATPTPAGRAMPTPTTIEVHRESYTHCTTGIAVMDEYASNDVVRWTADGSHILLTYSRAIWAVTADGSRLWRLARSWQKPLSGSDYSPGRSATFDVTTDGERVVYATCRYPPDVPRGAQSSVEWNSRFDYELAVVGLDGQGPRRLTRHPALDSYPAWSPDGTRIAFVSGRDDPDVVHGVVGPYTMAADGSDVRRLDTGSDVSGPGSPRPGHQTEQSCPMPCDYRQWGVGEEVDARVCGCRPTAIGDHAVWSPDGPCSGGGVRRRTATSGSACTAPSRTAATGVPLVLDDNDRGGFGQARARCSARSTTGEVDLANEHRSLRRWVCHAGSRRPIQAWCTTVRNAGRRTAVLTQGPLAVLRVGLPAGNSGRS